MQRVQRSMYEDLRINNHFVRVSFWSNIQNTEANKKKQKQKTKYYVYLERVKERLSSWWNEMGRWKHLKMLFRYFHEATLVISFAFCHYILLHLASASFYYQKEDSFDEWIYPAIIFPVVHTIHIILLYFIQHQTWKHQASYYITWCTWMKWIEGWAVFNDSNDNQCKNTKIT